VLSDRSLMLGWCNAATPVLALDPRPVRACMARAALIGEAYSGRSEGRAGVGEEQPVESGRAVRL